MDNSNSVLSGVKAVIISLIFTLISIIIFAFLLKVFSLPNGIVKPINYLIKCVSVFLGCYFSIKGENGALKGFIFGILIIIISNLLFSALSCKFFIDLNLLWDVLLGGVVGVIAGVVAVNKK